MMIISNKKPSTEPLCCSGFGVLPVKVFKEEADDLEMGDFAKEGLWCTIVLPT